MKTLRRIYRWLRAQLNLDQQEDKKAVKSTQAHLEAERTLRGKDAEELKIANRELAKQRRYRARRIIQEMQRVKNKQPACHALYCERERETTIDRQTWKEELERFSRNKHQDDEMRKKAKKELDDWDERQKMGREEWRESRTKADHVSSHAEQSIFLKWEGGGD